MKPKLSIFLALLLVALAACGPEPGSDAFATQVAREIQATQTALAGGGATLPIYERIQTDNASRLELLQTFSGDPITQLMASADGNVLAYVAASGIHILDPETFTETGFIPAETWIESFAISPDGRFLAAGDRERIKIWSLSDLSTQGTIERRVVNKLAFSPDSRLLVGITWDGVYSWQVPDGVMRFSTEDATDLYGNSIGGAGTFALAPTNGRIIFPQIFYIEYEEGAGTTIELSWYSVDPSSGFVESISGGQETEKRGDADISDLAISPDGSSLLIGRDNYPAEQWTMNLDGYSLDLDTTFPDQTKNSRQALFSPDGRYVGTVTRDNSVQVWGLQSLQLLHEWSGEFLALLPGGGRAAIVGEAEIQLVDLSSGAVLKTIPYRSIGDAAISPNGEQIALGWNDGTVEIWGNRGQVLGQTINSGMPDISSLDFILQGQYLKADSTNSEMAVWQTTNWERIPFPAETVPPILIWDSEHIISASPDPTRLIVWGATPDLPQITLQHPAAIQDYQLSPTEPMVAVHIADGSVWFWDFREGKFLRSLDAYIDEIIGFSADGKLLATVSDGQTLGIWSVADASLLFSREFDISLEDVTLSPDNTAVILSDWFEGITPLWRLNDSAVEEYPGSFSGFLTSRENFITETYQEINIWALAGGNKVKSFSVSGTLLDISADGSLMFILKWPSFESNESPTLEVWSTADGSLLGSSEMQGFTWPLLSEDSTTLVGLSNTGVVQVWGIPNR